MEKLDKIGAGNNQPLPKQTKPVVASQLNNVIEKVNTLVDNLVEFDSTTSNTYTLKLTDANKYISIDNSGAITVTIPTNDSVQFPIGATITLEQTGAGQITVEGDTGVTVTGNLLSIAQYSILILIKKTTDTWNCIGGTV